jgi:hypothetical protein
MPIIVNTPGAPVAEGSTPLYMANFIDTNGNAIPASALNTLTLTICDTLSGAIINNCDDVDILNTGRGAVSDQGLLTIQLLPGDTSMSEVPGNQQVSRSLVMTWTYDGSALIGRHQANFPILALAAP